MNITRRGFLGAILAAGTAPFVVRAGSLMAVRASELIVPDVRTEWLWNGPELESVLSFQSFVPENARLSRYKGEILAQCVPIEMFGRRVIS